MSSTVLACTVSSAIGLELVPIRQTAALTASTFRKQSSWHNAILICAVMSCPWHDLVALGEWVCAEIAAT